MEDFAQVVKDATGGCCVDVVIDFVGKSHWEKNIAALVVDARMVLLATLSGADLSNTEDYQAKLIARFTDTIAPHITGKDGDGQLKTFIRNVYPWTEIQAATREMEASANIGKIIVGVV